MHDLVYFMICINRLARVSISRALLSFWLLFHMHSFDFLSFLLFPTCHFCSKTFLRMQTFFLTSSRLILTENHTHILFSPTFNILYVHHAVIFNIQCCWTLLFWVESRFFFILGFLFCLKAYGWKHCFVV